MDRCSLSDPVAYIVCGAATFVTDVVPDNLNPVWLPKTRRACILPILNAYSQVYVGMFDYDGEKEEDDFTGRVVIDIPRLHAGVVYDITLPLRRTSHVYTRKRCGNIRLRIQVCCSERSQANCLVADSFLMLALLVRESSSIGRTAEGRHSFRTFLDLLQM